MGETIGANVIDEPHVMRQEDNERILVNNHMYDMVNDAFGHHRYSNVMVDDREMGPKSSHIINDDIGVFFFVNARWSREFI